MGLRVMFVAAAILLMTILQVLLGLGLHSPLLQISTAASLLALISINEKLFLLKSQSTALLFRAAGLVVFTAMMFINLTHCLEELTDLGMQEKPDHTHHSLWDHYNIPELKKVMVYADFIAKASFCFLIPPLSMPTRLRNSLILLSPPLVWGAVIHYEAEHLTWFGDWLDHHLEPLAGVILIAFSYSIVIPSLLLLKPFLLADSPPAEEFDVTEFYRKVQTKVPALENLSHVHASRKWPDGFNVTMKAQIRVSRTDPDWVRKAAIAFEQCKKDIHVLVKNAGANDVLIEPIFIDPNDGSDERNHVICIDPICHSKDVGCCTVPKKDDFEHCDQPV